MTWLSRAEVWQIRPMIYVDEQRIAVLADKLKLPIATTPALRTRAANVTKQQLIKTASRLP